MHRAAVLDLGTNTFNLIIAQKNGQQFDYLVNDKIPSKLGKGGIGKNEIAPDAYERGLNAIAQFSKIIDRHNVEEVKAFGTSALRTAQNAPQFCQDLKTQFGIEVEVVSGDREAELICKGVRNSVSFGQRRFLILDIGGGSNEFIITDQHHIYWKESFPLGIARLNEQLKPPYPISLETINEAEAYFDRCLPNLFNAIKKFKPELMVGASGAFDSFCSMIWASKNQLESKKVSNQIEISDYFLLHEQLINSKYEDLSNIKGLEAFRVEFIVLASVFVNYIVKSLEIKELWQTVSSLKEGAMVEMLKIE